MFNQGHRKSTRLKNSTALHCMCAFQAVLETQFTGAYKLSLQFLADILTTYTIYLASLLTFCLTWTTAFQKSLASTRWQSSHIWFWTTNSTTNTCCKMAPFNTCKDTVIRNPPWPASTAASRASRNASLKVKEMTVFHNTWPTCLFLTEDFAHFMAFTSFPHLLKCHFLTLLTFWPLSGWSLSS